MISRPASRGAFSLFSAYEKTTTKIVVADFILPLIMQTFKEGLFFFILLIKQIIER